MQRKNDGKKLPNAKKCAILINKVVFLHKTAKPKNKQTRSRRKFMSKFYCDSNCEIWFSRLDELGIECIRMPYTVNGEERFSRPAWCWSGSTVFMGRGGPL